MANTLACPFCSVSTESKKIKLESYYLFKCTDCGTFLMYDSVYRKMVNRGEYAGRKAELLEFIRQTPEDRIAYIGSKVETGLYAEYQPLNES